MLQGHRRLLGKILYPVFFLIMKTASCILPKLCLISELESCMRSWSRYILVHVQCADTRREHSFIISVVRVLSIDSAAPLLVYFIQNKWTSLLLCMARDGRLQGLLVGLDSSCIPDIEVTVTSTVIFSKVSSYRFTGS